MSDNPSPLAGFFALILFGSIFMLFGAFIVLASVDVIHVFSDDDLNAPRSVVTIIGIFFIIAGTLPMLVGLKTFSSPDNHLLRILYNLVVLGFLLLFAVPFHWAGFQADGELEFRVASILMDIFFLYVLFRFFRGDDFSKLGK